MGPDPEIMVGVHHLQHVFATPRDLDQRSSLLLGVQPSKIQVVRMLTVYRSNNICDHTTSSASFEHIISPLWFLQLWMFWVSHGTQASYMIN